jgi:tetratricopeptide (TPR) repeat protein
VASFQENFVDILMRAWSGQLEFAQVIDCAAQMDARKLNPLSAVLYQTWLSRTSSPYAYAVYFNLGVTLSNLDDFPNAEAAYRKSIELHPTFAQPRLNLGSLFERMGQMDKALAEWRWVAENISSEATDTKAMVVLACNHQGRVLETRKQMQDALDQEPRHRPQPRRRTAPLDSFASEAMHMARLHSNCRHRYGGYATGNLCIGHAQRFR